MDCGEFRLEYNQYNSLHYNYNERYKKFEQVSLYDMTGNTVPVAVQSLAGAYQ